MLNQVQHDEEERWEGEQRKAVPSHDTMKRAFPRRVDKHPIGRAAKQGCLSGAVRDRSQGMKEYPGPAITGQTYD